MSKQKSAIAGAVGLVVTVILTAIGLNVGILGATNGDEATPTSTIPDPTWASTSTVPSTTTTTLPTSPRVVTVYVDDVVPGAPVTGTDAPATQAAAAAPSAAPTPRPAPSAAPAPAARAAAPTPAAAPGSKAPTPKPSTAAAPSAPAAPTPTPAPTTPTPTAPAATYPAYDVPGIGTVTLQHADGKIHFWAVSTRSGWQYQVEDDGPRKVEVKFRTGGGNGEDEGEAKFQAELANGRIGIRVEQDD